MRNLLEKEPIRKGELGGFVESEDNLSQDMMDGSWVYDDSVVKGYSVVMDNSTVRYGSVVNNSNVQALSGVYWGAEVEDSKVVMEGKVYGSELNEVGNAHVKNSTIGHQSEMIGGSLEDSNVVGSQLKGHNEVKNSNIENSYVDNMTNVNNSNLSDSRIGPSNEVNNSEVINSFVEEGNNVIDQNVVDQENYIEGGISLNVEDIQDLNNLEDDLKL